MFSTASAYRSFFIGQHPVDGAGLLRKTRAPPKCKFFIWLVIHDRCWTAARRKKHGLQDDDACVLCAQAPETIDHLLVECSFSRDLWFNFFHRVGWGTLSPNVNDRELIGWWKAVRKRLQKADTTTATPITAGSKSASPTVLGTVGFKSLVIAGPSPPVPEPLVMGTSTPLVRIWNRW